jgi:hypothetical protein
MTVAAVRRVAMVRPPVATVRTGVLPLRAEPGNDSELVDEAHYGELLTVIGERAAWRYVQGPDLYFGWCEATHLRIERDTSGSVIGTLSATVRAAPRPDAAPSDSPFVALLADQGRWVDAGDVVLLADLPQRYPTADDLLATAESFLGAPYLWGGTTDRGIDCSGLTQQVYRLNGVGLDRDADQQALGGRPVDVARPGDLFFFGAERVTHTAIATGERSFIHAPESGKTVQRGELVDGSRLRAIRRYLP